MYLSKSAASLRRVSDSWSILQGSDNDSKLSQKRKGSIAASVASNRSTAPRPTSKEVVHRWRTMEQAEPLGGGDGRKSNCLGI